MLTGINFSPPLYFLFNFCLQLIFPTSIEQLRIQSLAFIIIGIILSFLLSRKIFGAATAFIATILISSQSSLLLSQSQEARHYAMFFACGAWVLYMQSFNNFTKRNEWLTFFAHLCFCQVHYLGIIFSLLTGFAYFLTSKYTDWFKRIPRIMILSWLVSIASCLFYLTNQKSILNSWPKPNDLSQLFSSYNDSILYLTVLIPVSILFLSIKSNLSTQTYNIEENYNPSTIIITSVLWFSVPFIFWIISRTSSLNLFVDRYFIPKESALIFLVAYGFSFIFHKLPKQNEKTIPMLGTMVVALMLLLLSTKRSAFGLNKNTNYHHSLIIEESYPISKQPIVLAGDPKYFPNAYLGRNEFLFALKNESLIGLYSRFSAKIKFLD